MPFGEYDDFDDCVRQHQDEDQPGAVCAEIHYQITGEYPGESSAADFHSGPEEYVETALKAMQSVGADPTEDRLADMRRTESKLRTQ